MKTPYVGGRIQPKVKPAETTGADTRVQDLQAACIRERINHKNELRRLTEYYDGRLAEASCRVTRAIYEKHEALQRQRWYMGALCFVFLLLGLILGDALAPYDLR